jgi:hypothetical protein
LVVSSAWLINATQQRCAAEPVHLSGQRQWQGQVQGSEHSR